ncbi:hypothetical protein [Streptomyces mirabilis]
MADAEHLFASGDAQLGNSPACTEPVAGCEEEARAVPVLRAWLGNSQDHPLLALFGPPADLVVPPSVRYTWWRDPILTTFNDMLAILERTGPAGLDRMRNRFRELRATNPEGRKDFMNFRAEVTVAAFFAEHGLCFGFNTDPGPDLLLTAPSGRPVAVEISTRAPHALSSIANEVVTGLRDRSLDLKIHFHAHDYPPVSIRSRERDDLVRRVVTAATNLKANPFAAFKATVIPDRPEDGYAACTITVQINPLPKGSGIQAAISMSGGHPHEHDVASEVAKQPLRDKKKQAQARTKPTLLIADITGLDGAGQHTLRHWSDTFASAWAPNDPFVALAAMICPANHLSPQLATSHNPHADPADLHDLQTALVPVRHYLGL